MEPARIAIAGIAFSVAAWGAVGDVIVIGPGPCSGRETYLLASNSGAIIRVDDGPDAGPDERVIVYRRPERTGLFVHRGWASRRLLSRFDFTPGSDQPAIVNSGAFCRGSQ